MFCLRFALALLALAVSLVYGAVLLISGYDRALIPRRFAELLAKLMLPAFGVRVEVQGEENLYAQRPCVYLTNHQTLVDVPVVATVYPPHTVVIGKKELRKIPIFGWLFVATGNVLIDRSNREQAVGRMKEAEDAIRERRVSVWIFPEGTRGRVPGELLPFKKGAFHLAIRTGVPLVPVVISPLQELVDFERRRVRPGTAEIRVLEPIPTEGLTEADLAPLMQEAHQRMSAALHELAARRTPWLLTQAPGRDA